jgi:hypothetical protein
MIPYKIDSLNIRFIYNVYLTMINNIVVYGFRQGRNWKKFWWGV